MMLPGPHSWQLYAFALSMLGGMGLGLAFDLYRAARAVGRSGPIITAAGDLLFVAAAAVWLGWVISAASWGELRLYVLVAVTAGVSTYAFLASPTVLPAARVIWRLLFRVLRPVAAAVRTAVRLLAGAVRRFWPAVPDHPEENH